MGKRNQSNYKFSSKDTYAIVDWMNSNLYFSFMQIDKEIDKMEKQLIVQFCPILNTKHNPHKSKLLASKREECRNFAKSL